MFHFSDGEIILIDKEINWTSFDVVNYLKPAIQEFEEKKHGIKGKIKIGHAGTLDPLATGLLILCTGKKTKDIQKLMDLRKTYIGTFCLGATTASFDKEQPIHQTFDISSITEEMIHSVTKNFIGKQLQVPPVFSAVRVRGKRAYELVRQNVEVELKPKPIEIYRFEITNIRLPYVDFMIECSKGTYIRAIARDFGHALNNGAYLENLRRAKIGEYDVNDAMKVREFLNLIKRM
ncbi:MAG: tRNA pseudouridine(55) synthase TruB [Bacteroidetes bacterium]|nr:MAG: tRNA pseudouridine(55) synthase TruB [Bacteroidota bacterium]